MIISLIVLVNLVFVMFGNEGFVKNIDAAGCALLIEICIIDVPVSFLISWRVYK